AYLGVGQPEVALVTAERVCGPFANRTNMPWSLSPGVHCVCRGIVHGTAVGVAANNGYRDHRRRTSDHSEIHVLKGDSYRLKDNVRRWSPQKTPARTRRFQPATTAQLSTGVDS